MSVAWGFALLRVEKTETYGGNLLVLDRFLSLELSAVAGSTPTT